MGGYSGSYTFEISSNIISNLKDFFKKCKGKEEVEKDFEEFFFVKEASEENVIVKYCEITKEISRGVIGVSELFYYAWDNGELGRGYKYLILSEDEFDFYEGKKVEDISCLKNSKIYKLNDILKFIY